MNEPDPTEPQVAYRLAYEEVVRWRAELDAQLDRIRTRAMAFFGVAVIAAGTGSDSDFLATQVGGCSLQLVGGFGRGR